MIGLIDWLNGESFDRFIGWGTDCLIAWSIEKLIGWSMIWTFDWEVGWTQTVYLKINNSSSNWSVGWVVDQLTDSIISWLMGRFIECFVVWLVRSLVDRSICVGFFGSWTDRLDLWSIDKCLMNQFVHCRSTCWLIVWRVKGLTALLIHWFCWIFRSTDELTDRVIGRSMIWLIDKYIDWVIAESTNFAIHRLSDLKDWSVSLLIDRFSESIDGLTDRLDTWSANLPLESLNDRLIGCSVVWLVTWM